VKFVFVTGMFRSGTTLIARMLNTHSQIVCASDPLRPLFNSYRYSIADHDYRRAHSRFGPLDDYFLSHKSLLNKILNADFNIIADGDHKELLENIKESAMPFSGLWAASLDSNLEFSGYKELMDHAIGHINTTYGSNKNASVIAFKEVWATEFAPAFLRSYPDSKAVIIIRDPRAVVSSNIASGRKYPIFFLARQWRKLSFVTHSMQKNFKDDLHVIEYEDLIKDPELEVRKLTDFIGVPFEEDLLDISKYFDGNNERWKQNTNYNHEAKLTINSDSLERWRSILQEPDTLLIELICRDWMETFGYECSCQIDTLLTKQFNEFRQWPTDELAEWIKPYSFDEDDETFSTEVLKEKMRLKFAYGGNLLTNDESFALQIQGEN